MLAADGAVRLAGAPGHAIGPVRTRRALLVEWLAPVIDAASTALHSRARAFLDRHGMTLAGQCRDLLEAGLAALTARTVILEMHVARMQGKLVGRTSEERFDDFFAQLQRPDSAAALLREYPELARRIQLHADRWRDACVELMARIDSDRERIAALLDIPDPGLVTSIEDLGGDRHRGGRFVARVSFECGASVVHKPRPIAIDALYQGLLTWTAECGFAPAFRPLRSCDRGEYGWVEFVEHAPCRTIEDVERFFVRQGALIALMRVCQATDLHFDNLIASGEHPVIVDLETLFHPGPPSEDLSGAQIMAAELLADSVLRTGLLPAAIFRDPEHGSIDVSGIEGLPGQRLPLNGTMVVDAGTDRMRFESVGAVVTGGRNRPQLGAQLVRAFDYAESITAGFSRMYELLLQHRDALDASGGWLERCTDITTRVVLRPTRSYALCLDGCLHPDALRDAALQRRVLSYLPLLPYPSAEALRRAEWRDLEAGDVPFFSTRPSSHDVWTSDDVRIPGVLEETGLERTRRVLRAMGDADFDRQIALMSSALATVAPPQPAIALPLEVTGDTVDARDLQQRCLETACEIGDRLVDLAIRRDDEATWIGISVSSSGRLVSGPLACDLYSGIPGIALFLNELARATGTAEYDDVARAAARLIYRQVERDGPWRAIGAFGGWAGVAYVLARLWRAWGCRHTLTALQRALSRIDVHLARDGAYDVVGGSAGCVLALLAVERMVENTGAGPLAAHCGSALTMAVTFADGALAPRVPRTERMLCGFAHGTAGLACALDRLAAFTGDSGYARAADAAVAYERALFDSNEGYWPDLREGAAAQTSPLAAWCHGAVGIGLGRLASGRARTAAAAGEEVSAAVECTLSHGFGADQSLCHGDCGSLELLSRAASAGLIDVGTVHAAACAVLDRLDGDGWICGVPGGSETPGLMTGLAGIGYGLLQLSGPSIPSVLTLDS